MRIDNRENIDVRMKRLRTSYLVAREMYNNTGEDQTLQGNDFLRKNTVVCAAETITPGSHGAEQLEREERNPLGKC